MKTIFIKSLMFLLALGLLVAGPAIGAKKTPKNDDNLQRRTVYNFEDDVISGSLRQPDETIIDSIRANKYSSLIKIRTNFVPEIIKSAEDL